MGCQHVVTNAAGQTIKQVGLIDSATPFTYDVTWNPFGGMSMGPVPSTGTFDVSVDGTVSTWTGWIDNDHRYRRKGSPAHCSIGMAFCRCI